MPLFCCYSDVELAANEMQVEAHEKPQFRLKMVNLGEENPRKWYQSSLFPSQRIYLVYRGLLAAYFIAWWVSQVVFKQIAGDNPKHFIYLTTWAETTLNMHLIASFLTCLYGYVYEFVEDSATSTPASSEINFHGESAAVLLPHNNGGCGGQTSNQLRWFHKLSWALYSFSLDVGLSVTIAFWALLRTEFDAFSWHCHAINSLALLTDLIVSDTPIRILHTCYTFVWGLTYILFTYLLYKYTQFTYIYEGVLQWGEYPGITCAVVFGVCFGLVPFSQCVGYWIYTFKYFILTKYYGQNKFGSDEQLAQHKYSGFGEKYANASNMPIVSPMKNHIVTEVLEKEAKRTRRRTNSGLYDKLESLPPSDM